MARKKESSLHVVCPCCSTRLTVDRITGSILLEERVKQEGFRSLEEAAHEAKEKQVQAREQLDRAMDEARHRDEIMEKKFKEALKKAEESDEKPPRPFDLD